MKRKFNLDDGWRFYYNGDNTSVETEDGEIINLGWKANKKEVASFKLGLLVGESRGMIKGLAKSRKDIALAKILNKKKST